jgi:hypothetical protein
VRNEIGSLMSGAISMNGRTLSLHGAMRLLPRDVLNAWCSTRNGKGFYPEI